MAHIVPVGGRIKSAAVGLNHLFPEDGDVDDVITLLRRDSPPFLKEAFFPRVGVELRQALRGLGFFRPSLKTDQGMGGNFLPFRIDANLSVTDFSETSIAFEEGYAIPEYWHTESQEVTGVLQDALIRRDLDTAFSILQTLPRREADKGRLPYFMIRPAASARQIIFGRDVLKKCESSTTAFLEKCIAEAQKREMIETGSLRSLNLLYVQPDIFVLGNGRVHVERINCPDVGFFLTRVDPRQSRILPQIADIVSLLRHTVMRRLCEAFDGTAVLITRDRVVENNEDILEILEIQDLTEELRSRGIRASICPLSKVDTLPCGTRVLLMNLDYARPEASKLLHKHGTGELECFPNPYLQMTLQSQSGLHEVPLDQNSDKGRRFLSLARAVPRDLPAKEDVHRQINAMLQKAGLRNPILLAQLKTEVVQILTSSLHSWRQLAARAERPENRGYEIRFREIPIKSPQDLLLTSDTGPRLHAFRFMYVT